MKKGDFLMPIKLPDHLPAKEVLSNEGIFVMGEDRASRTSKIVIDEFRGGKIGKITLELPEDISRMAENTAKEKELKKQKDSQRKADYKKTK